MYVSRDSVVGCEGSFVEEAAGSPGKKCLTLVRFLDLLSSSTSLPFCQRSQQDRTWRTLRGPVLMTFCVTLRRGPKYCHNFQPNPCHGSVSGDQT